MLRVADLTDQGILVELKLPLSSKRLDVMLTGAHPQRGDSAVIVELKQWTEVWPSAIPECVTVDFGGGHLRDHLHPSRQVAQYERYLLDTHPAFTDGAVGLASCAWLHNAQRSQLPALDAEVFQPLLATNPSFTGDQLPAFEDFLVDHVPGPDEGDILEKVASTTFRPHKRLLNHVANVIRQKPEYVLLDEQLVAYNAMVDGVRSAAPKQGSDRLPRQGRARDGQVGHRPQPRGGARGPRPPSASPDGQQGVHGEPAQAGRLPRGCLVQVLPGHRARRSERLDVVVLDEAHRIRTISTDRFTPAKARSGKAQIDDILDAAGSAVFFIDDLQVVRPGEVGSTALIREAAGKRGIEVREFELDAQFRANGSDAFIQWVDNTLELAADTPASVAGRR